MTAPDDCDMLQRWAASKSNQRDGLNTEACWFLGGMAKWKGCLWEMDLVMVCRVKWKGIRLQTER